MENLDYGPLNYFIGKWESLGHLGENRAPDPGRNVENTKFRQIMTFEPLPEVKNHEQLLRVLRYHTKAWEEGDDEKPFHEEVGYFIWDEQRKEMLKSFIVPRGIAVNAGCKMEAEDKEFTVKAELGSTTYGVCSNKFLDDQFQTVSYEAKFTINDANSFSYDENTRIKIKDQEKNFDHTEKNVMTRA
jgi:hypothetical protein